MPKRRPGHKPAQDKDSLRALLSQMALSAETYLTIKHHLTSTGFCALCRTHPAQHPALFIADPAHSAAWGGTQGKWRLVFYHVCERCFSLPDWTRRAEAQITRQSTPERTDLDRLRRQTEASMPPGRGVCVLCGASEPALTGAGVVDGQPIGYHLCENCLSPTWIEQITAKVRGEMFLRRRN